MENDLDNKKQTVLIRTPDHHLRVFVSSTLRELEPERRAVRKAITKLHLAPVMFESGARPHPAQDLYQAYLSQSHIFIGIYWQSYGWQGPGMQVSGLEDEYIRSAGLPRLIYIKHPAPDRDPALDRMLAHIRDENSSSYKHFATPDELSDLVEDDLILLLTEYFETARTGELSLVNPNPTILNNLPIPRNPIIGRDQELKTTRNLLLRDDVALVTLTGPAGTGKSRLAIQVTLDLRQQFNDGVFMVSLESIHDPRLVLPSIAKTLNIAESISGLSLLELLKGYLCHKQTLLLLDNFEQVLPAATHIAELLEACPRVKILVTSRASLHLRPEKEYPIPPLKVPPLNEISDLSRLTQYSAVQLFIQRCQAVKADFQVTDNNATAIAQICHRLDGLPLAIELAASRIKLLPPQALLSHLRHRFDVLRGGTNDLPERQRTMYRAIDWSYSLLDKSDQQLFERLSVFCSNWTVEAAIAVCANGHQGQVEILDGIERLVDNNLIRASEDVTDEPRLKMLESIREFAYQHLLQNGEANNLHERCAQYYLSLSEQAESGLFQASQQDWHQRVDAELDNLRCIMGLAIEHGQSQVALRITTGIWRYWWVHGYWSEGLQWLKDGLTKSESIPVELRAKALTQIGWLYRYLGDFPQAIAVLEESLELYQQVDNRAGFVLALSNLGASVLHQGDTERARHLLEDALSLSRQQGDKLGMYISLEILGHGASRQGNSEKAIEFFREALALAEQAQDEDQIAKILNALGDEYVIQGDYDLAEACFTRAATICKKLGNRIVGAWVCANRSIIAIKKANYGLAFELLSRSISEMQELGDKEDVILCLEPFAYIARELHEPERAIHLFGASETQRKLIGITRSQPLQADYDMNIAALTKQLGETSFKAAWDEGSKMTLDQAVAYAIQRLK